MPFALCLLTFPSSLLPFSFCLLPFSFFRLFRSSLSHLLTFFLSLCVPVPLWQILFPCHSASSAAPGSVPYGEIVKL
ncbi:MAG: hypothetical protein D6679_06725 [Candidatus Hydrogenedentota bacterium]|nr:MAG: hypothetical protein D6679_06725 [Candidatus Hydrogenedentota bacterium]